MGEARSMSDVEVNPPADGMWLARHSRAVFARTMDLLCAGLLLGISAECHGTVHSDPAPKTLREQTVTVVFTVRIVPRGTNAVKSPRINMRLPVTLPQQTVTALQVEGTPKRVTDCEDAPVLVYEQKELRPGRMLTGRWTASARVREFQWTLPSSAFKRTASLSSVERTLYLRDAVNFGLTSPVVLGAAQQATAGKTSEPERLEGIFDLIMAWMQYDRDGKWQPAPVALAAGKGSCSEYSYAFIALCRASGIPARYVGGFAGRAEVPFHVDTVFHRYPQAYVEGVGWVDFDPTRTDSKKDRRLYFGRTSPNMLLVCAGDGGEGSLTGWDYLESHSWAGGSSKAVRIRTGWWFPEPPPALRKSVVSLRKRLSNPRSDRKALVAEALRIGHPFVLPWLDDLLYEPPARIQAAGAFLKIGSDGALRPIINSLARMNDPEGDRQIGELLNEFSGESWGADRAKWQ